MASETKIVRIATYIAVAESHSMKVRPALGGVKEITSHPIASTDPEAIQII